MANQFAKTSTLYQLTLGPTNMASAVGSLVARKDCAELGTTHQRLRNARSLATYLCRWHDGQMSFTVTIYLTIIMYCITACQLSKAIDRNLGLELELTVST